MQASAKALNGAREDKERIKERAISRGRRTKKMKIEGEIENWFVPVEENVEERFWPINIR